MINKPELGGRYLKYLCVDDPGLGPTDAVCFGGLWKPVSCISGIFEFCSATLVVFYF